MAAGVAVQVPRFLVTVEPTVAVPVMEGATELTGMAARAGSAGPTTVTSTEARTAKSLVCNLETPKNPILLSSYQLLAVANPQQRESALDAADQRH